MSAIDNIHTILVVQLICCWLYILLLYIFRHNCGAQYHPKKAKLNVQQTIQYCFFAGTIGLFLTEVFEVVKALADGGIDENQAQLFSLALLAAGVGMVMMGMFTLFLFWYQVYHSDVSVCVRNITGVLATRLLKVILAMYAGTVLAGLMFREDGSWILLGTWMTGFTFLTIGIILYGGRIAYRIGMAIKLLIETGHPDKTESLKRLYIFYLRILKLMAFTFIGSAIFMAFQVLRATEKSTVIASIFGAISRNGLFLLVMSITDMLNVPRDQARISTQSDRRTTKFFHTGTRRSEKRSTWGAASGKRSIHSAGLSPAAAGKLNSINTSYFSHKHVGISASQSRSSRRKVAWTNDKSVSTKQVIPINQIVGSGAGVNSLGTTGTSVKTLPIPQLPHSVTNHG